MKKSAIALFGFGLQLAAAGGLRCNAQTLDRGKPGMAPQGLVSVAEARAQLARSELTLATVRGQVTFSHSKLGMAFVQDATGGIAFDPRLSDQPAPAPGDWVEVTGTLTYRQGMVMMFRDAQKSGPPKVTPVPREGVGPEAMPFELEQATQMRIDGLLTSISGIVRRCSVPKEADAPMHVEVSTPTGHAIARLPWREPPAELERWLNAPVTMEAVLVCQAEPPLLASDADALLLVPAKSSWRVQKELIGPVFARPPVRLSPEMLVTSRNAESNRLHVQGVVTGVKHRQWLTLRTHEGQPVQVMTRQMNAFEPGDRLSVACWAQIKGGQITLLDGICRRLNKGGEAPEPQELGEGRLRTLTAMNLVHLTGVLRNHSLDEATPRLTLTTASGEHCLLQWHTFLTAREAATWKPGSTLSVTGILNTLGTASSAELGVHHGIQPRSLGDVKVIRGPSWWTRQRLGLTASVMLALATLGLVTTLTSRWQIRRQKRLIREIEAREIAQEERRRISREFHDSLQQQLAGAALHLDTLKGALQAAPDLIPSLVEDTAAMIRHCQMEARNCIWDLRHESGPEDLAASVQSWVIMRAAQVADWGKVLKFEIRGRVPDLDSDSRFQVQRIIQEAVNNAIAHAEATQILVVLEGTAERLSVLVEDDGRGFDPEQLYLGRFGLRGQRERAQRIGAQLHFTSPPQQGTRMILCVPVRSPRHALSV